MWITFKYNIFVSVSMSNTFYKNYGTYTLSQSKRLIVNKNSRIHNIHICAEIGDVEQTISIPNMNNSYVFQEIGAGNWGDVAIELNIILYPIESEKRITKNKLEYRMMVNVNVYSKRQYETEEDKKAVKELFCELAENAEQDIHIHVMDYYCLESND